MLGEQVGLQDRLFYEFDLDDRVPADHLLRRIDTVLDLIIEQSDLDCHFVGIWAVAPWQWDQIPREDLGFHFS